MRHGSAVWMGGQDGWQTCFAVALLSWMGCAGGCELEQMHRDLPTPESRAFVPSAPPPGARVDPTPTPAAPLQAEPGLRLMQGSCEAPYVQHDTICVHEVLAREVGADLPNLLAAYRRGSVPPSVRAGRVEMPGDEPMQAGTPAFAPGAPPPAYGAAAPSPAPAPSREPQPVFAPEWVASVEASNQAVRDQRRREAEEAATAAERAAAQARIEAEAARLHEERLWEESRRRAEEAARSGYFVH